MYDSLNRLTGSTDEEGNTWSCTYDAARNRTGIRYPDGSAAEQYISTGQVDARKSITNGLNNAVSNLIYGTNPLGSVKEAFGRGFGAGAAISAINYISDLIGQKPEDSGAKAELLSGIAGTAVSPFASMRDPRRGCGSASPFTPGIGYSSAKGYRYDTPQTANQPQNRRRGFSLKAFLGETLLGGFTGGFTSAAFYGAGKGIERLKEDFLVNRGGKTSTEVVSYYPANNGAIKGTERRMYLMAGDKIDRYGKLGGKFFSPAGTPLDMRALPYNADLSIYTQFEVMKPFEVKASTIAPAFGKIGLGTQYRSTVSANTLLKRGIIKVLGGS